MVQVLAASVVVVAVEEVAGYSRQEQDHTVVSRHKIVVDIVVVGCIVEHTVDWVEPAWGVAAHSSAAGYVHG